MAPWNKDVFPLMSTFAEGMSEILGLGLSGLSRKLFSPYLPPPPRPAFFPLSLQWPRLTLLTYWKSNKYWADRPFSQLQSLPVSELNN